MSGIHLLVEIHRQKPKLPVLILTAHATLETAIQAVRLGARDYLIKPVEPELLLARLSEILNNEEQQPARKREIVGQVQDLLAELQQLDGSDSIPINLDQEPSPPILRNYSVRGRLLWIYMPGMTGIDLFRQIRRSDPNAVLILITAFGTDTLEQETHHLVDSYITKPFELELLIQFVQKLLNLEATSTKHRILILEDDMYLRQLINKVLKTQNFEVCQAESLKAAGCF